MVQSNFEDAGLPIEAVEHLDGAVGVDVVCEEDGAEAFGAVLGGESDVGSEHCTAPSEEVFEVLPSYAKGQLWELGRGRHE